MAVAIGIAVSLAFLAVYVFGYGSTFIFGG
jgi:hypothetical protein